MAKKGSHIDEVFKKGLSGLEQPLNGLEWGRLMEELHPPKKKKFLWWWFVLAFLVAAGGILTNVLFNSKTPSVKSKAAQEVEQINELDEDTVHTSNDFVSGETDSNPNTLRSNSSVNKNISVKATGGSQRLTANIKADYLNKVVQPQDSSRERKRIDVLKLFPKTGVHIGQGIQVLIPTVIQLLANTKLDIPRKPSLPAPYLAVNTMGVYNKQQIGAQIPDFYRLKSLNEAPTITSGFGVEYGQMLKGMDFKTGLQYLQKGQKLDAKFTYQIYDSIPYIDLQGDTTYIPWNYRDTSIMHRFSNPRYNYLVVPLSVGKSFDVGEKYKLGFGIQAQARVLIHSTGTTLNSSLRPIDLNGYQMNRFNFAFGGYAEIVREMNMQMDLGLRFNLSQDLNNMLRKNVINQKFTGYGAGISVRYKLY